MHESKPKHPKNNPSYDSRSTTAELSNHGLIGNPALTLSLSFTIPGTDPLLPAVAEEPASNDPGKIEFNQFSGFVELEDGLVPDSAAFLFLIAKSLASSAAIFRSVDL